MMISLGEPSLAELTIVPLLFTKAALSTTMAELPEPDTTVVMCPVVADVSNTTI